MLENDWTKKLEEKDAEIARLRAALGNMIGWAEMEYVLPELAELYEEEMGEAKAALSEGGE
jgi:hypothetical protein